MRVDGLPSLRPPVITVSIGAAVAPADGRTVQAAMHAADDALYAAKEAGRNRIETARKPAGS
jgi:diguanylate cyclase (GGDEF)-like protein